MPGLIGFELKCWAAVLLLLLLRWLHVWACGSPVLSAVAAAAVAANTARLNQMFARLRVRFGVYRFLNGRLRASRFQQQQLPEISLNRQPHTHTHTPPALLHMWTATQRVRESGCQT